MGHGGTTVYFRLTVNNRIASSTHTPTMIMPARRMGESGTAGDCPGVGVGAISWVGVAMDGGAIRVGSAVGLGVTAALDQERLSGIDLVRVDVIERRQTVDRQAIGTGNPDQGLAETDDVVDRPIRQRAWSR